MQCEHCGGHLNDMVVYSTGRTLLMCAAPDFTQHTRTFASDAVLLTTTVDVAHAGLP